MRVKQYESTIMYVLCAVCLLSGIIAVAVYAYRRGRAAEIKRRNGWS